MKQCPKCSAPAANEAWLCPCGYEFDQTEPTTPDLPPSPPEPQVRATSSRVLLYLVTWLVALLTLSRDIRLVTLLWVFPIGLCAPFSLPQGQHEAQATVYLWILGGWALYLVHAVLFFRTTRIPWLTILYVLLCLLLITNVSGCQHMLHGRAG